MSKRKNRGPQPPPLPYPYLAVRFMPAIGAYRQVAFVTELDADGPRPTDEVMGIVDPEPSAPAGELTPARRAAAIAAVVSWSHRWEKRMALCFGPGDAVYVEPDGRTAESDHLPFVNVLG